MEPLAHRLRPTKLSDVIGQEYLTGKDGIITKMIETIIYKALFYMVDQVQVKLL